MKIGALIILEPATIGVGFALGVFGGYFLGKSRTLEKQLEAECGSLPVIEDHQDKDPSLPEMITTTIPYWTVSETDDEE